MGERETRLAPFFLTFTNCVCLSVFLSVRLHVCLSDCLTVPVSVSVPVYVPVPMAVQNINKTCRMLLLSQNVLTHSIYSVPSDQCEGNCWYLLSEVTLRQHPREKRSVAI